jgi:S1-C subfamily serine protease
MIASPPDLTRVERAVIEFPRLEGRAVLIPGGFVLSAAHCIGWSAEGYTALDGGSLETGQAADGRSLTLNVLALEPVPEIAILGSPDDQRFSEQAEDFARFVEETEPVPLFRGEIPLFPDTMLVLIFNRNRRWVLATAKIFHPNDVRMVIAADERIEQGASGGPIVTLSGELVGVVSWCSVSAHEGAYRGQAPRPLFALPVWAVNAINASAEL